MWKHILPQIRTLLPILLSFEMGAALLQLAELGFLGFFLGGGAIRLVPEGASAGFIAVQTAGEPELGQMLSAGWENFFLAPWMAVWAGTAFTLAIFSFMILGEGLKRFYAEGRVIRPFRRLIQAVVGS
jgi:ABC-type dipeptide/oligopeptide/nickel transport system permease subunit